MNKKPIRVLIVEDSPVVTIILKRLLGSSPEIEVVGTARTGIEGLEMIPNLQPDVICTDLNMPKMDGLEFTQEVMANFPRPILVISASVQAENTQNVFQLLQAGAVDVFPKPRMGIADTYESIKQELIGKIKILSGVAVFTLRRKKIGLEPAKQPDKESDRAIATWEERAKAEQKKQKEKRQEEKRQEEKRQEEKRQKEKTNLGLRTSRVSLSSIPATPWSTSQETPLIISTVSTQYSAVKKVVAIGASTGGPQALHAILTQLPADFAVPTICVQHISEGFLQGLVDWLASECHCSVKIATAYDWPKPGTIYFPPERRHLELDAQGRFIYSSLPPVSGHCPSVTVTFNSVAKFYGKAAVGILLTGMGRDGADGMHAIASAGGLTIAQDEKSSVVFGMPKEAIALGAAQYILPVNDIAPMLLSRIFTKKI